MSVGFIYFFDMSAHDPQISLEQWRTLMAVVDEGGYAQAASALHKSQSAVSYAVQKIEALLRVKIFELHGRKAVLTNTGHVLVRRARTLVDEAAHLESGARKMSAGWSPELNLSVNVLFPADVLFACVRQFAERRPETRIEVYETVLSSEQALLDGTADIAITSHVPPGYLGTPLLRVKLIAAAHPKHPLHQLKRKVTVRDLRRYRQLVVRDSGPQRGRSGGWLGAEQRLTVTNLRTSIQAAAAGLGYAWYPAPMIRDLLAEKHLKALPLGEAAERHVDLYLVFRDADFAPPDQRLFAELVQKMVAHP